MTQRQAFMRAFALGALLAISGASGVASAEPKAKAARKAPAKAAKKKPPEAKGTNGKAADPKSEDAADPKTDAEAKPAADTTENEAAVQGAGTKAATAESKGPDVVKVKEKEGVKNYQFGAIEVEGRLKSPQVIYFLRRVRAEFDAAQLGHRSFLRELSDTRRHPSFR